MIRFHNFHRVTAAAVCAAILSSTAPPAPGFPPQKPYDPRPLMPAAEKKVTGDKYTFIVMGDSKNGGAFDKLVKRAESLKPALVLLTGDMVVRAMPRPYDVLERQIGAFARKVPCWPCPGNHDIGGLMAKQWPLYVKFWGINTRHYSFDFKNARFICVDAPVAQPNGAELAWLEKKLTEGRKAGKLMFVWQHMPCYTVGRKKASEIPNRPTAFTRLCAKYGVVGNFSGHDHIYYRTFGNGVSYIIQALGGAGIYAGNRRTDAIKGDVYAVSAGGGNMLVHNAAGERTVPVEYMLTVIQVDGKKVTGRTITAAGKVIDEFALAPPPKKAQTNKTPDKTKTQPRAAKTKRI